MQGMPQISGWCICLKVLNMMILVRLANGAVRRTGTTMNSVTGGFAKTAEAKRRRRSICIVVGRKPVGSRSGFGTGTRTRRAFTQALFLGNNVSSSARNHAIRQASPRVGCGPARTRSFRDEWVLILPHSWVLRQAWSLFIVCVVLSCCCRCCCCYQGRGRGLLCRDMSFLCRSIIGVVATWIDWRFPCFDLFVLNRSGSCASLASTSTAEQTTAAKAEKSED